MSQVRLASERHHSGPADVFGPAVDVRMPPVAVRSVVVDTMLIEPYPELTPAAAVVLDLIADARRRSIDGPGPGFEAAAAYRRVAHPQVRLLDRRA